MLNFKYSSDIEWKFARSKLYMEYIKDSIGLPVPFNLIPNTSVLLWPIYRLINIIKIKNTKRSKLYNVNAAVSISKYY